MKVLFSMFLIFPSIQASLGMVANEYEPPVKKSLGRIKKSLGGIDRKALKNNEKDKNDPYSLYPEDSRDEIVSGFIKNPDYKERRGWVRKRDQDVETEVGKHCEAFEIAIPTDKAQLSGLKEEYSNDIKALNEKIDDLEKQLKNIENKLENLYMDQEYLADDRLLCWKTQEEKDNEIKISELEKEQEEVELHLENNKIYLIKLNFIQKILICRVQSTH